jgi:3-phosphoshikimate 1-carboxyvinyltransferase
MSKVFICPSDIKSKSEISITGSKSESNRLLVLNALYSNIELLNLSNSDDTKVLIKALSNLNDEIDIHHAGTAMRFLTAFLAQIKDREFVITGSARMQERPIGILVDSLNELGFDVTYLDKKGFPPLKISGKKNIKSEIKLNSSVSSQYISALMLVAPSFENGLKIILEGQIISKPYINLTLNILKKIGVNCSFKSNIIEIKNHTKTQISKYTVESDWSSASYYYSIVSLLDKSTIVLSNFFENSFQGDSKVSEIYESFGVNTTYKENAIHLTKMENYSKPDSLEFDLLENPDLAQTISVTALCMGIPLVLTGLKTLKIKETDRIIALQNELSKFGASVICKRNSICMSPPKKLKENITIKTYNDHRMALSFSAIGLITPIYIEDHNVVSKSYPGYWSDLKSIGFNIEFQ